MVVVTLNFAQLRQLLPHGPGMVLLDRVEELRPGVELRAVKSISGGELCYAGVDAAAGIDAFAYPASLLLESFGQAAAVLWLNSEPSGQRVLMFAAAKDCRFTGHAYPGDVIQHVVRLEHRSEAAAFVSGHTSVGTHRIASYGSLTAVVRPRSEMSAPAG